MSSTAVAAAVLLLTVLFLRPTDCRVNDTGTTTNYRLAGHVKPVHYSLTLAPFIYSSDPTKFHFTGSVRISVRVITSTNNFHLHSRQLFIKSLQVLDCDGASLAVRSIEEDTVRQWQNVIMEEPLMAGSKYTIVVDRFTGQLGSDLLGLYLDSYTENGVTKYLVASQLEATYARNVFPCFDEPALKATFDVSLVRRHDFMSISNMPTKTVSSVSAADWFNSTTSPSETMVKEDFDTTPVMSTYLLAFVVSQFACRHVTDNRGRLYSSCSRPEVISDTDFGAKLASQLNQFFEGYFDLANPLGRIGQVAVPRLKFAGMENWGLILYKEEWLIYNATWTTSAHQELATTVIGHEMCHQWFGNLVTMAWWNEIWLNEALPSFFSYFGANQVHPDWELDALFVPNYLILALLADSSPVKSVEVNVQSPEEIAGMDPTIKYLKGGSVVRMMHNALGAELFRSGLSSYLKINSYSNTVGTDLYQSLTQQVSAHGKKIDVGEVMDTWIKQAGYPVVNCSRHDHHLQLTQQHFLENPSEALDPRYSSPFNYTWIIPVTMVTKDNESRLSGSEVSHLVHWMRDKSQSFSINGEPSWYLLNVRSTGLYRVNYDEPNWNALISQLLTDHTVFTPHDRARMLDDSYSLARAGYISYEINMKMLRYLMKETHLAPWKAVFLAVQLLPLIQPEEMHNRYQSVVNELIESAYRTRVATLQRRFKWAGKMARQLAGLVTRYACYLDLSTCRADAARMCRQFVASNFAAGVVPPDVRSTVLCVGMAGSGANAASSWQKFTRARDAGTLHVSVLAELEVVAATIAKKESVTDCIARFVYGHL